MFLFDESFCVRHADTSAEPKRERKDDPSREPQRRSCVGKKHETGETISHERTNDAKERERKGKREEQGEVVKKRRTNIYTTVDNTMLEESYDAYI